MDYCPDMLYIEILSVLTHYTFHISQDDQLKGKVDKIKGLQQKLVGIIQKQLLKIS